MADLAFHSKTIEMVGALIFVLFLFLLCIRGIKSLRKFLDRKNISASPKQIYIKESLILDTKRRLVRVQNKDIEHLLLLGPANDLLLQSSSFPLTSLKDSPQRGDKA